MSNTLEKLQSWGLLLLIFLVPVFFLTLTSEFFDFNKLTLLVIGTILLLAIWAMRGVFENKLSFVTTPFDLAVVLVAAAFILSTILQTTNKIDAFLMPGPTTIILACTFLYFVATQTMSGKWKVESGKLQNVLLFSGLIVALVSIAAGTGILEKIPQLPPYIQQKLFSLAGASLPTVTFLAVLLPLVGGKLLESIRAGERESRNLILTLFYSFTLLLLVVGIVTISPNLFPINKLDKPTGLKILPVSTGWAIAVETLKQSPFGVGPGNFISAFNQYRPISFNQTEVWNLRFSSSSNWYLQVFTEVGIVGLVAVLFLVWRILRSDKQQEISNKKNSIIHYTLYIILLLFLIIPASLLLLMVFYLMLGMVGVKLGREVKLSLTNGGEGRNVVPWFLLVIIIGGAVPVFIFGSRAYGAEMNFKQALTAAARGDGKTLYDQLVATIAKNPRVDRYRIAYAQTNLAIANSLAQKKDITDTERNTISQLVQQAIREGQAAVALNRALSINWEVLGAIYRSLIPFAQGSDQFAVSAYSQAIALEPVNPFLRIALGGVHYGAGRMDEAVKTFELAVATKPDLANAHYNLSAALREKGDVSRAVQEMEQVLSLVQPNTQDYQTAQQELTNLKSKLPKESTASGETLQAPQPTPAPVIRPPLELPPEAAPPVEGTPAPSPSPSPSPSP